MTITEQDRQAFLAGTRGAVLRGTAKVAQARATLAAAEAAANHMSPLQGQRLRRKVRAAQTNLDWLVAELRTLAATGKRLALISDDEYDAAMNAVRGN